MQHTCQRSNIWTAVAWVIALTFTAVVYTGAITFAGWEKRNAPPLPTPVICLTRPGNGETGVLLNTAIAADVYLPHFGEGVATSTMNTNNVKLLKLADGKETEVQGHVNTSGGGDSIVFQPMDMLDAGTTYKFVCKGVRDGSGALFQPFEMKFTTAANADLQAFPAAFEHIQMPKTWGTIFTGLTVGPDHRLYAGTFDGRILRYDFLPDGTLSDPFVIDSVLTANKSPDNLTGNRLITGICFDPASKPDKMISGSLTASVPLSIALIGAASSVDSAAPIWLSIRTTLLACPAPGAIIFLLRSPLAPTAGFFSTRDHAVALARLIPNGACEMSICSLLHVCVWIPLR